MWHYLTLEVTTGSEYGEWHHIMWQWLSGVCDDQPWPCIYSLLHFATSQISWGQLPSFKTVLKKRNSCRSTPQRMYFSFTHSYCRDTQVTFRYAVRCLNNTVHMMVLSARCCCSNTVKNTWMSLDWNMTAPVLWIGRWCLVSLGRTKVKALRYKPADREFVPWWCHWNFSAT